ncbi:WD40 repeat-like protein [Leucogyrophana mollusca]|uniref:WD40 repeat-like protein n=1 Tax=Leucogyrophana mollusca TaxID=85980 RepID=A0ACB8B0G5_9AGAM|nr:WD40 repeat-like protein [Leucogyrophana mollusca]
MSTPSNAIEPSGVRRASRGPTKVFEGHNGWINAVAYFPDGRRIATASNNAVIIWDVESDRQDGQSILHGSKVICIAISPNGRRIASGMEGGVVIWDALTREMVHEIKGDGVHKLAYSPDGCWIATASTDVGREVQLWDADTGKLGREPLGCDGEVFCMGFSPDGSRIAVGFWDGSFEVIDIATGESVIGPIKGHTREVWLVVYSPDGRLLVTGSRDSSIRAWDSKTGVAVGKPMLGHKYGVDCISVSADGRRIASGGDDKTVRVWDLEIRLQIGDSLDADGRVNSLAFSPDRRYIISGGDHLYLFNTESLERKAPSSPPTTTARIPPVGISCAYATSLSANIPCLH